MDQVLTGVQTVYVVAGALVVALLAAIFVVLIGIGSSDD